MRHLESENAADAIEALKKVNDHSMRAFRYAEGQGATEETLKNALIAKQLNIFSEILIQSYDGTKIIPFSLLDEQKKRTIGRVILIQKI